MDRRTANWIAWAVAMVLSWLALRTALGGASTTRQVSYDAFELALSQGRVDHVQATDTQLVGHLAKPEDSVTALETARVEPELAARLDRFKVPYERSVTSSWGRELLSWLLTMALMLGMWSLLMRRTAGRGGLGGLMGAGRSGAKVHVEAATGVTFDDVAGIDEAKAELQEVVEFLCRPKLFGRLGAHIPRGVLLVGPPGTGKTMLAKAVAGQARVPFFSISGSEFVEMFVGVGAARVRDLFEQARRRAPAIVFIDELDALGRIRGAGGWGGNDEKDQTLNQLLTELDGFDSTSGIVVLAATNRPEILDPALLRAGRFDRQVLVDRPDRTGRAAILGVHARKVRLDASVRMEDIAGLTAGFSGADLARLVNEAALAATRRNGDSVTRDDFVVAIERIVAGLEKRSRVLSPKERERVAWHEMGHALVALSQRGGDRVRKVSIVPRGTGSLGYTLQTAMEDRYLMSREELEGRLQVLMAGRAAEVLVFGQASTGAADDLARATDIATDMVSRLGMDAALGNVAYDRPRAGLAWPPPDIPGGPAAGLSEDTRRRIDEAVRGILARAFDEASRILQAQRAALDRCAHALLERETLDEAAIVALAPELAAAPA